jgi:adenine-specific DNA-methyltransferase
MTDSHAESTVTQPAPTEKPERLDLRSHEIVSDKQKEIVRLFPDVRTEGGKIDFDRLKRVLGEIVDPGKERYGMNWAGKADCFNAIQTPSVGTLVPCREESVNFDTTGNLVIDGDNLEVLKLLQKAYLGKVKMIYIDPPYNTGNDFIYPDNYTESLDTYLRYTGQIDDEGRKYSTNSESDGRFHSRWMNMMYPRLFLARNLLKDDGVIFISIGEKELSNLEKICNEIFGEDNQLSIVARIAKTASDKGTFFAPSIDFILCYGKSKETVAPFVDEVDESLYKKIETEGPRKGDRYRDDIALYQSALDTRPNQKYFIQCPDGSKVIPPTTHLPPDEIARPGDGVWRWSKKDGYERNKHLLVFKRTSKSPLLDEHGNKAEWNIYTKSYLSDRQQKGTRPRNFIEDCINRKGADLIKKYGIEFDYSKPIELMGFLIDIIKPKKGDIVLDFFSGSASTAHSVIEKNRKDGSELKFVMVQLPEPLEGELSAENAGLKTVADIGKERIRRVLKELEKNESGKLLQESAHQDRGFKVFKLQSSCFMLWNTSAVNSEQELANQLQLSIKHIISGRSQADILYELLLKSGFPLDTKIDQLHIAGKIVYSVADGAMLICLDVGLTTELIKAIAERKPERVMLLDEGFAGNDQLKANAVQIMKSKGVTNFRTV